MTAPATEASPRLPACVFCGIVAGHIPSERVAESEGAFAFLTIEPLAEGHTVVVPRRHAADVAAVTAGDGAAVWRLAVEVERRLRASGLADGVTWFCASGRAAEQAVSHLHVHLIPRRAGDPIEVDRWWTAKVRPVEAARQAELGRRLRSVPQRGPHRGRTPRSGGDDPTAAAGG